MLNTKDVYKTYIIINNRKCVMLWAAQAYARKKTAQNDDYVPGGGVRRGGKQGRKCVRPGVLETTINSNLNYIKDPSPYLAVNTQSRS